MKLLSVAEKIICSAKVEAVTLGEKVRPGRSKWIKLGLRARVQVDETTKLKVQVVLVKEDNSVGKTKKWIFFSVHIIK